MGTARINVDGAARGNPGPAAFAFVIQWDGKKIEDAGELGRATNNVAEYSALVKALERAAELGARELDIRSDSELMVRQMKGIYRVKNADLKDLYEEARELTQRFDSVKIEHIAREANSRADELCNLVLDGQWRGPTTQRTAPAKEAVKEGPPCDEAVGCLTAAAQAWARGNPADPAPIEVWHKLWAILEARRLVRNH